MNQGSKSIMVQIGLALLTWILPSSSTLTSLVDNLRKGLLATIITGVLSSSIILLAIYSAHQFLLTSGVEPWVSLLVVFVTLAIVVLISGHIAKKHFHKTIKKSKNMSFFDDSPKNHSNMNLEAVIAAFLEGYLQESQQPAPKNTAYTAKNEKSNKSGL